jgi:hypothetical protein
VDGREEEKKKRLQILSFVYTMSSTTSNIVFDDIFTINGIDKEGKKFDRGAAPVF